MKITISYKDREVSKENDKTIMGGDPSSPSWKEYLNGWKKEDRPYVVGIRKAIKEAGILGKVAGEMANDTWFEAEDGVRFGFSWRAWGDLMQAIVNKNEGYMSYYM